MFGLAWSSTCNLFTKSHDILKMLETEIYQQFFKKIIPVNSWETIFTPIWGSAPQINA